MRNHIYYRLEMQLASPLSVGNGKNEYTDHDFTRGKDGKPYIPASSIAGVFRHTLDHDTALQNNIFGTIADGDKQSSKVIFYDGELLSDGRSSVRDRVKLENKVGVDGGKYDMEVVETGESFVSYIEMPYNPENIEADVEKMIRGLADGSFRFGADVSRGYGAIKITSLKKRKFDLDNGEELDAWLELDIFDASAWEEISEYTPSECSQGFIKIQLRLAQNGAISIREYSTDVGENGEALPDFKHISLSDGTGVIPGSSWAGAFRARYSEFAGVDAANELFGYVKGKAEVNLSKRSRIVFSESIISDNLTKMLTRNSIDRFSSATKDTALYTERTCYNGRTELEILLQDDVTAKERGILAAVILDMHNGFLSVGGLTAVGRGMFSITGISVNGEDRSDMLKSNNVAELLEVKE